jgi:protein-tyrosine phosphatase
VSAVHIQQSVTDLNKALVEHGIPLIVLSGAEIRIDERIPELLARGELLPLGDTQEYVLVEWPFETCFHPRGLLELFKDMGYKPIIAHPERNQVIAANPSLVMDWIEYNPIFQITGASLMGQFGRTSTSAAWALLDLPVKSVVCTDAHDTTHRAPVFIEAFGAIVRQRGVACAQRVCIHGPLDIVGSVQPRSFVPNYSKGNAKSA